MAHILHLSDLHITDDSPNQTLETLWIAPSHALRGEGFDFIIISGDLSQRSDPGEYTQLSDFALRKLLPLLKRQDNRRIICVPGNHDVNWDTEVATRPEPCSLPTDPEEIKALYRKYNQFLRRPTKHSYRFDLEEGFLQFRYINGHEYPKRFANIQRFFNDFYKHVPPEDLNFDLLAPEREGKDLSLHVFREEGLAFFGFNSCYWNDKYWTGAHINPDAIRNAQELTNKLSDLLLIAVWHHGLARDHAELGYLSLFDLQMIRNVGCTIGFHGHIHEARANVSGELLDQMAVISTGSLGAGGQALPEAVGSQFSIVDIYGEEVQATVYARREQDFRPLYPALSVSLPRGTPADRPVETDRKIFVKTHRRTWEVSQDAITRTTVELEGVIARTEVPLAIVRPYRRCESGNCQIDQEIVQVREDKINDARRFTMPPPPRGKADKVIWKFDLSNAMAVYKEDLAIAEDRSRLHKHIHADEDAIAHYVRFDTERLELALEFSKAPAEKLPPPEMADVRWLVEAPVNESGEIIGWMVPRKRQGCTFHKISPTKVSLKVDRPRKGYRYSIVYKPGPMGTSGAREGGDGVASEMITILRKRRTVRTEIEAEKELLKKALAAVTDLTLSECVPSLKEVKAKVKDYPPLTLEGDWCCFLWDPGSRQLVRVIGEFPAEAWSDSFAVGHDVEGHAFRFSNPVANLRGRRPSLIASDRKHEWDLCFPLLMAQHGPSAGVISFSGLDRQQTAIGRGLRNLAVNLCKTNPDEEAMDTRKHLLYYLSVFFWYGAEAILTVAGSVAYAEDARKIARAITSGNPK